MKIQAAAIQMPCDVLDLPANLQRADELLRGGARRRGRAGGLARAVQHRLQPLPRLRTVQRDRGRPDPLLPAAAKPAVEDGDRRRVRRARGGRHLYDSLAFCSPDGDVQIYRKRNLVFWERFRFRPGPVAPGRRDAVRADRLRRLRRHDLPAGLGRLPRPDRPGGRVAPPGPTSPTAIPAAGTGCWATSARSPPPSLPRSPLDLGIPVIFANQCGETRTTIPVLADDDSRPVRRPEQHLRRPSWRSRSRRREPSVWPLPSPSTPSED